MKSTPAVLAVALATGLLGCATIWTKKADLAAAPEGVRVYPPKLCILVDAKVNSGEGSTIIAYVPDFSRAYDVKPVTVLAKQDFKLELEEGQVKALTSNQDTTAFLEFLKEAAQLAAKAAGAGVSASAPAKGTFGFSAGVHCMKDDGTF